MFKAFVSYDAFYFVIVKLIFAPVCIKTHYYITVCLIYFFKISLNASINFVSVLLGHVYRVAIMNIRFLNLAMYAARVNCVGFFAYIPSLTPPVVVEFDR